MLARSSTSPIGTVGTTSVGGTFRVVTTSLVPGGASQANGSTMNVYPAPTSIIINFSQPVNKASVAATDLILSGSDLNPLSPAKATSVTWLDNHTAQFNLTGQFNSSGTVNVSIPAGAVKSVSGSSAARVLRQGRADEQRPARRRSRPPTTPTLPAPITPAPAPAPTAPPKKTKVTRRKVVTPPAHKKVPVVHKPAQTGGAQAGAEGGAQASAARGAQGVQRGVHKAMPAVHTGRHRPASRRPSRARRSKKK